MMMWKDSYKLGVDRIDKQHKELFDRTEKLLRILKNEGAAAKKQECKEAIAFLKSYAVEHFSAEEEFQRSIGYHDYQAHRQLHRNFVSSVVQAENRMVMSDFDVPSIKEFVGFLMAWLVYHVAHADQDIVKARQVTHLDTPEENVYIACLAQSADGVLRTLIGTDKRNVVFVGKKAQNNDLFVQIDLHGSCRGEVVFAFSKETIFGLIKAMTNIELSRIDELAYSALSEISNIITGNAATLISASGRRCSIDTPLILLSGNPISMDRSFHVETAHGNIVVGVNID